MEEMVKRNQPYVIGGLPPATAKPQSPAPNAPAADALSGETEAAGDPGFTRESTKDAERSRLMTACQKRIFGGMARCPKGQRPLAEESARGAMRPWRTLAWLFLAGLRPRRARLRFTKHP